MDATFLDDHTMTHIETVEEDRRGSKGELRNLQKNSSLNDKIYTFRAPTALFNKSKTIEDGRRVMDLLFREHPLILRFALSGSHVDHRRVIGGSR